MSEGYHRGTNQIGGVLGTRPMQEDTAEVSASLIRDRLGEAEERLANLHAEISHLESRLDSILTPQPPKPSAGQGSPTPTGPPISHVHDRACALYLAILEAGDRLRSLMQRIEL